MKCKQTIGALVFIGVTSAFYYYLTRNQGEQMKHKLSSNVEIKQKVSIPDNFENEAFMMPHFMIKNLNVSHHDNGVTFKLDYKIDRVLYDYLMHHTPHYRFRFTLPQELKSLFEGNGTERVLGELVYGTGEKSDYTVSFNFIKRKDTEIDKINAINEMSGPYHLDIVDEKLNVLNVFEDVYGAANMMRF
ncbi:hypothetical protein [Macrococcus armenti]|uniref:hypothetical protein n=1 Tax=Macrococcus armenti TaxID=2875764 RepID=UPI001CCFC4B6|nr:hypothetical protein [Macrococcus armenti]UBH15188.1 hypothetical protein LAU44_10740 [Macrococcus armenti]UBH17548.1 hypothetical protein LAU39_10770 [Macrococcus armenti]UBH19814.1 hypothetical protein LAU40_10745 [Macrococcus armenti]